VIQGSRILLSIQRPFPQGAGWRFNMRPVNLAQRPAIRCFTRETFLPVGSSVGGECVSRPDAPTRGSLYRIATSTLVPAGMSFVSQ
jgi:hypothetical protein